MEISYNLFVFLWMEKKLILLSHFSCRKCMSLILWLWSLELNDYAFNIKTLSVWSSSNLVTSITFFVIVDFFLFFVVIWTLVYIFEPLHIFNCKVEPLAWTTRNGSRAFKLCYIINCKVEALAWTARNGSRAFKPCHIFNCKVKTLYDEIMKDHLH